MYHIYVHVCDSYMVSYIDYDGKNLSKYIKYRHIKFFFKFINLTNMKFHINL